MSTTEILENIKSLLAEAEGENTKSSKAAHGRARKLAGEIKSLAAEFKRQSVVEDKK